MVTLKTMFVKLRLKTIMWLETIKESGYKPFGAIMTTQFSYGNMVWIIYKIKYNSLLKTLIKHTLP